MLTVQLPSAGVSVWAPGIVALGFAVGFLTGMFGVGGGFIITPFLKIVFGIPYPTAVGCGLAQIFVNASFSAWHHWRGRSVDLKLGALVALGAICGTEVGVRLLAGLGAAGTVVIAGRAFSALDFVLNCMFLALMIGVGVSIVAETSRATGQEAETPLACALHRWRLAPTLAFRRSGIESMSLWVPLILSFFVGILTGLLGVGGGFVNFPILVYVLGVPTLVAVGTSAFQIVFASAYGAVRHAREGHVELLLVGLLVLGSLAGVRLGVGVSRLVGGRKLRKSFGFVLLAGIILVLWNFVR